LFTLIIHIHMITSFVAQSTRPCGHISLDHDFVT